jgi:monothiol glutaredoxin
MKIKCYLKPSCGWSNGVRAIMKKYALAYDDVDIINVPANYAEMVERTGQRLSPCVEIDGEMLADVSGAEVEQYLLAKGLVQTNDVAPAVPTDAPCTDAEHEKMKVKTIRFF